MITRLRRQATAVLILMVLLALIALAWMWAGILHPVGGLP
jgi:hypothetical protein